MSYFKTNYILIIIIFYVIFILISFGILTQKISKDYKEISNIMKEVENLSQCELYNYVINNSNKFNSYVVGKAKKEYDDLFCGIKLINLTGDIN